MPLIRLCWLPLAMTVFTCNVRLYHGNLRLLQYRSATNRRKHKRHLLQTIPVSGKSGDLITKAFANIQYMPVQTKSFEDIEIF